MKTINLSLFVLFLLTSSSMPLYAQDKPSQSGSCINASGGQVSDELKDLCLTKEELNKKQ